MCICHFYKPLLYATFYCFLHATFSTNKPLFDPILKKWHIGRTGWSGARVWGRSGLVRLVAGLVGAVAPGGAGLVVVAACLVGVALLVAPAWLWPVAAVVGWFVCRGRRGALAVGVPLRWAARVGWWGWAVAVALVVLVVVGRVVVRRRWPRGSGGARGGALAGPGRPAGLVGWGGRRGRRGGGGGRPVGSAGAGLGPGRAIGAWAAAGGPGAGAKAGCASRASGVLAGAFLSWRRRRQDPWWCCWPPRAGGCGPGRRGRWR